MDRAQDAMTPEALRALASASGLALDDATVNELLAIWPKFEALLARVRPADPLALDPAVRFAADGD